LAFSLKVRNILLQKEVVKRHAWLGIMASETFHCKKEMVTKHA
jgi:hypothetical protein